MRRKFLFSIVAIILIVTISHAERFSFKTLLADPSKYNNQRVTILGVVERVIERTDPADGSYYEIDVYRDITVIVEQAKGVKGLRPDDLIEIKGIFYEVQQYRRTLYNNLIISDFIRKLEAS